MSAPTAKPSTPTASATPATPASVPLANYLAMVNAYRERFGLVPLSF